MINRAVFPAHLGRAVTLLVILGLGTGCVGPESDDDVLGLDRHLAQKRDLIADHSQARLASHTRLIDFGTPNSRPFMVSGWSDVQASRKDEQQTTITWAVGPTSILRFFVGDDLDTMVRFRCSPVVGAKEDPGVLEVLVNGQLWTEIQLKKGLRNYRRSLPGATLAVGWNTMTLRSPAIRPSEPVVARFERRMIWDRIDLGAATPNPAEPPSFGDDFLLLPAGAEVAYNLDLQPDSWLALASSDNGAVIVTWETVEAGRKISRELRLGSGEKAVQLTGKESARGRLSLLAAASNRPALRLSELAIISPAIAENEPKTVARAASQGPTPDENPALRPNVIVYLVDTLRADHMGCYGYDRPTTPNIDEFASRAVLFENAQAQSPWTRASIASIFTGMWPEHHGAQDREHILPDEVTTLAEILSDNGYESFGVTGNGNSHEPWGFAQGFQALRYVHHLAPKNVIARSTEIHAEALHWVDQRNTSKPFFLWVHTVDPHAPYEAEEPHWSRFAPDVNDRDAGSVAHLRVLMRNPKRVSQRVIDTMIDLYDAEIASNDATFGRFLDDLRARNLFDSTLIIFVSDHGEEFFDHGGWTHGKTLYTEMLDVPLIIKPPGATQGRRLPDIGQHIDLLPTILDYAGLPAPPLLLGTSLRARMSGDAADPPAVAAIAQMRLDGRIGSSMVDDSWKVVVRSYDEVDAYPRLYDRQKDRRELTDISLRQAVRTEHLAAELRRMESQATRLHEREQLDLEADPELLEQLKALGYVE